MPTSWVQSISEILSEVEKFKPKSILDIGIGFGKYGVLLRETMELAEERYEKKDWKFQLDGIEAFRDYHNPIHDYVYDNVYYDTVSNCIEKMPNYDVVLMIDVIEHFEKAEGKEIIRKTLKHTNKALIISTPLYPAPQEEYLSNKYEEHKSRWTQVDFADFNFHYKLVRIIRNGAQLFVILPPSELQKEFPIDHLLHDDKNIGKNNLTIGYFLPHKNLTGGLKMLLEQMKHLRTKGHKIYAFYKSDSEESALPTWIHLQVDKEIIVPNSDSYVSYIQDCDVGVAGWIDQIPELSSSDIPIVYWEQGNEYLFGDSLTPNMSVFIQYCYQQPVAVTSVSPIISKILKARFGRKAPVIPNGIDTDFYFPGERPNENIILLVGNPNLLFKGFDVALQTLIRVWRSGHQFKIKWVCQVKPDLDNVPFPFPIEYVVMPTQEKLAECYRESDIFLFTSWYEGFGMPPLEAMASGLPVVVTSCGGIEAYAKSGYNALIVEPGDTDGLTEVVIQLLNDDKLRDTLSKNGRETALLFSSSKVIHLLEDYLYQLVSFKDK